MSRDHRKLRVFDEADKLVMEIYSITSGMPDFERYGLQSQLRRAAVSVPCNIVEGAARPTDADYFRFLHVSRGSAREVEYLLSVSRRLGFVDAIQSEKLEVRYSGVQAALWRLVENSG